MEFKTYMKQLLLVLNKAKRSDMVEWGKLLHQMDHYGSYKKKRPSSVASIYETTIS